MGYLTVEKTALMSSLMEELDRTELGSIRNTVGQLFSVLNNPNVSAGDLTRIIEIDPPLVVKILSRANSAYYGGQKQIKTIQDSIVRLGLNEIREIVIAQKIFKFFTVGDSVGSYSGMKLWKHSIAVALMTKYIFNHQFGNVNKHVYTAGLLHDIGIIIENQFFEDKFRNVLALFSQLKKNLNEIEEMILGFTHADIGAYLAEKWGLPDSLLDAIAFHHNPSQSEYINRAMLLSLNLADQLAHHAKMGFADSKSNEASLNASIEEMGIRKETLTTIIQQVKKEINELENQGLI
ncbi:MAG: HDOD domain-containing protein [Candidatus Cloacimonetes bacterium]|nr:HDOD domain-containing protein [Candidatus Cloacimonadota bacterium]